MRQITAGRKARSVALLVGSIPTLETKVHRAGSTFSKRLQVLTVLASGDFSSDSIGRAAASAKVARAKATVEQAEAAISAKQQELDYLAELPNLDPLVMEHEQAKLAALQRDHTPAVRDFQLAQGKLSNAQADTDYQAYRHSLDLAERVERANQVALSMSRACGSETISSPKRSCD